MQKVIILAGLVVLNTMVFAENSLPMPKSGLQIIPLDQMNLPVGFKNDLLKRKREEKIKGFTSSYSDTANFLLNRSQSAQSEIIQFKQEQDPADTHLKASNTAIATTFIKPKLSLIQRSQIIGYAPFGAYLQQKQSMPGKWTGIKMFFNDDKLGTCEYSILDIKASGDAVQIGKEIVTMLINNKPTTIQVVGSKASGYLVEVAWFTNKRMQQVSCATLEYNPKNLNRVIELSRRIDNQALKSQD